MVLARKWAAQRTSFQRRTPKKPPKKPGLRVVLRTPQRPEVDAITVKRDAAI